MSEQDPMDRLLREAMTAGPVPGLSTDFERKLAKRIRPARLNTGARLVLALYTVLAAAVSVWALKNQPLAGVWLLLIVLALVPLSFTWAEKLTREYPSLLRRKHPSV